MMSLRTIDPARANHLNPPGGKMPAPVVAVLPAGAKPGGGFQRQPLFGGHPLLARSKVPVFRISDPCLREVDHDFAT